ncbi:MAG: O-phospho-L-seryl-tRNA:Cys-tRNA synthase [Candidatus Bathyarchaeota archaeon]|nr:O-phospho-L-seryl-tRNA:Cys-tRNA synthase [Candidatus Bathyarchaeota archaeon]
MIKRDWLTNMVKVEDLQRYNQIRNPYKDAIIVQPIMTGGVVPEETQKRLFEEGWTRIGYSICFNCLKGRSSIISKPPVEKFLEDVAKFFGGERAEHTFACRAAQFAAMKAVSNFVEGEGSKDYAKIVVADPLCHYTTAVAAEVAGLRVTEPGHSGHPEYRVEAEDFRQKIEDVKEETGRLPGLIAVTHVEPYHGNLNPAEEVGEIAEEHDVPYMVNAAYTAGIMPVNMRELHADFLTVSAHKSMASLGPLGFLVTNGEYAERAFRTSKIMAEGTGRTWKIKIPNIFGCSVGGLPLISAMYSFPRVVKRVERWGEELEKTRWFIKETEKIDGVRLVGERPHRHHLLHFETPIFYEISKHHKRRGFFLAEDMTRRGIVGLHRGLSKNIKLSLYGLEWDEVKKVRDAFREIVERYVKKFDLNYAV